MGGLGRKSETGIGIGIRTGTGIVMVTVTGIGTGTGIETGRGGGATQPRREMGDDGWEGGGGEGAPRYVCNRKL